MHVIQIQKGNEMLEGQVTYEEGDLVEATFDARPAINVGEPVRCMVMRSFDEMYTFEGIIIAKDDSKLYIFHSPTVAEFREQRRRYPRFDVNVKAFVQMIGEKQEGLQRFQIPTVEVINVGLGGLAFRYEKQLEVDTQLAIFMELLGKNVEEGAIGADLVVIHAKEDTKSGKGGFIHGCRVTEINGRNLHKLRKYLLQRQLEELKNNNKE